jgi:hypothetical protein
MEHPNAVHGLRSQYLSDEDRELYEQVSDQDDVDLLREELHMKKTKLLRATRATEGNEGVGMAMELLEKIEDGEADDEVVSALAKLLSTSNDAIEGAVNQMVKLAKEIRKQEQGDTVQVEHSGQIDGERTLGDKEKETLLNAIDPANGSS